MTGNTRTTVSKPRHFHTKTDDRGAKTRAPIGCLVVRQFLTEEYWETIASLVERRGEGGGGAKSAA